MKVWPYDPARIEENKAGGEPITSKQIGYILKLSRERDDKDEFLNGIMDSIPGDLDIEDLSKGQAMYVIKCLLGEIKQVEITPDIQRRIADSPTKDALDGATGWRKMDDGSMGEFDWSDITQEPPRK